MKSLRFRDWIFAGTVILLAALCVRLGIWQLDRLQQRRESNAWIESHLAQLPIDLKDAPRSEDELVYRRVIARGVFDTDHQFVLTNRSLGDLPGVHLVTPSRLEATGTAVLINRGWLPIEDASPEKWAKHQAEGTVTVVGIARSSQEEPRWSFLADPTSGPGQPLPESFRLLIIDHVQSHVPRALLPVYVQESQAPELTPAPVPHASIALSQGPHLSYAIQWFSFAGIGLIGGGLWLRRRVQRRRGHEGGIRP